MTVPVQIKPGEERDNQADITRSNNRIGVIIAVVVTGAASYGILKSGGTDITQELIALFTFVAALATGMQWLAMVDQNIHMRAQTDTMVKQSEQMAEQTKTMIAQNEAIEFQVEQARLEQRAWLGITQANLILIEHKQIKCGFHVSNSGETPGKIVGIKVRFYQTHISMDPANFAQGFEALPFARTGDYVVSPGATIVITADADDDNIFSPENGQLFSESNPVSVLAMFRYEDIWQRPHDLKAVHTGRGGPMRVRGGYCSMD